MYNAVTGCFALDVADFLQSNKLRNTHKPDSIMVMLDGELVCAIPVKPSPLQRYKRRGKALLSEDSLCALVFKGDAFAGIPITSMEHFATPVQQAATVHGQLPPLDAKAFDHGDQRAWFDEVDRASIYGVDASPTAAFTPSAPIFGASGMEISVGPLSPSSAQYRSAAQTRHLVCSPSASKFVGRSWFRDLRPGEAAAALVLCTAEELESQTSGKLPGFLVTVLTKGGLHRERKTWYSVQLGAWYKLIVAWRPDPVSGRFRSSLSPALSLAPGSVPPGLLHSVLPRLPLPAVPPSYSAADMSALVAAAALSAATMTRPRGLASSPSASPASSPSSMASRSIADSKSTLSAVSTLATASAAQSRSPKLEHEASSTAAAMAMLMAAAASHSAPSSASAASAGTRTPTSAAQLRSPHATAQHHTSPHAQALSPHARTAPLASTPTATAANSHSDLATSLGQAHARASAQSPITVSSSHSAATVEKYKTEVDPSNTDSARSDTTSTSTHSRSKKHIKKERDEDGDISMQSQQQTPTHVKVEGTQAQTRPALSSMDTNDPDPSPTSQASTGSRSPPGTRPASLVVTPSPSSASPSLSASVSVPVSLSAVATPSAVELEAAATAALLAALSHPALSPLASVPVLSGVHPFLPPSATFSGLVASPMAAIVAQAQAHAAGSLAAAAASVAPLAGVPSIPPGSPVTIFYGLERAQSEDGPAGLFSKVQPHQDITPDSSLSLIRGLGRPHIEALAQHDIKTIKQLASLDPDHAACSEVLIRGVDPLKIIEKAKDAMQFLTRRAGPVQDRLQLTIFTPDADGRFDLSRGPASYVPTPKPSRYGTTGTKLLAPSKRSTLHPSGLSVSGPGGAPASPASSDDSAMSSPAALGRSPSAPPYQSSPSFAARPAGSSPLAGAAALQSAAAFLRKRSRDPGAPDPANERAKMLRVRSGEEGDDDQAMAAEPLVDGTPGSRGSDTENRGVDSPMSAMSSGLSAPVPPSFATRRKSARSGKGRHTTPRASSERLLSSLWRADSAFEASPKARQTKPSQTSPSTSGTSASPRTPLGNASGQPLGVPAPAQQQPNAQALQQQLLALGNPSQAMNPLFLAQMLGQPPLGAPGPFPFLPQLPIPQPLLGLPSLQQLPLGSLPPMPGMPMPLPMLPMQAAQQQLQMMQMLQSLVPVPGPPLPPMWPGLLPAGLPPFGLPMPLPPGQAPPPGQMPMLFPGHMLMPQMQQMQQMMPPGVLPVALPVGAPAGSPVFPSPHAHAQPAAPSADSAHSATATGPPTTTAPP